VLSREQINRLYQDYGYTIYQRCRRILQNDAEAQDALQDIFCQVVNYRKTFLNRSSPLNWLHRITTNHCYKRLKQNNKFKTTELQPESSTIPAFQKQVWISQLMNQFDEKTQQLVMCIYFEGLLQEEAAQVMGVSTRMVRKRLKSFLEKAQVMLAHKGGSHAT
jgi:RNA polymerase sigma-70 factor (ECF subfamily)